MLLIAQSTSPDDPRRHQTDLGDHEGYLFGDRRGLAQRPEIGQPLLSAVTIGEIEYDRRILPAGKLQLQLRERFERFVALAFTQRVLVHDEAAARSYGEIMGYRKEIGRPMSVPDGQLAAIASAKGRAVATRNISDFEACGIDLVDPFLPMS